MKKITELLMSVMFTTLIYIPLWGSVAWYFGICNFWEVAVISVPVILLYIFVFRGPKQALRAQKWNDWRTYVVRLEFNP